ncbi:MAG: hypothetical protein WBP75_03670 [Candidatus Cybelea sp.]
MAHPVSAEGSPRLVDIKLDAIIDSSGGIQWDGKHVAVGAYISHKRGKSTPVIYQFAIAGTQGEKVGTTILGSPAYLYILPIFHFAAHRDRAELVLHEDLRSMTFCSINTPLVVRLQWH